jgi:hypothetical protein
MAKQWFIVKDGKQYGPMAPDELKRKAASGELQPDDWVRPDDRQDWYKASAVKGLFTSTVGESLQQGPSPPKLPAEQATPPRVERLQDEEYNPSDAAATAATMMGTPPDRKMAMSEKEKATDWTSGGVFGILGVLLLGFIIWLGNVIEKQQQAAAEKERQHFLDTSNFVNETEYREAIHKSNQILVEALGKDNPDYPTVQELDRMNELGRKQNPTLGETDEYNRIKKRASKY